MDVMEYDFLVVGQIAPLISVIPGIYRMEYTKSKIELYL